MIQTQVELFHVKRAIDFTMEILVTLIVIGPDRWVALLADGSVLLTSTRHPRPDVAAALLQQGMDPRSLLTIRVGSRIIARDSLGSASGRPVTCRDVDVVERS